MGDGMQRASGVSSTEFRATRPFVILNPVAGKGRAKRVWPTIRPTLRAGGLQVEEAIAEFPMHAWTLAEEAAKRGHDLIIAVGGDGTTHEVINGLLRGRPADPPVFAVIPLGTANDFPRALSIPKDPIAAARTVLTGVPRRIDLGRVNDHYFATIAGVGFDAEVAQQVNRWPRWFGGTVLYVAGILKMLLTYHPVEAHITIDGQAQTLRLFLLAAGNTRWYGGGMYMCPHAEIDDGQLAIIVAKDLGRGEALAVLPKVFSGNHLAHPKVVHTSARRVQVESATPLAVHADGESVGHVPASFSAVAHALDVIVPQGA